MNAAAGIGIETIICHSEVLLVQNTVSLYYDSENKASVAFLNCTSESQPKDGKPRQLGAAIGCESLTRREIYNLYLKSGV